MPELSGFNTAQAYRDQTVRVAALAGRQHGVVGWGQLRALGVTPNTISTWIRNGRIIRVHPRVYAVGHRHLDDRGRAVAALLYAGPGAALSHTTAAWHWKLLDDRPTRVHVSAPGYVGSLQTVAVHHPRSFHAVSHNGMRVTAVGRTLVDIASMLDEQLLAKAVATASHGGLKPPPHHPPVSANC